MVVDLVANPQLLQDEQLAFVATPKGQELWPIYQLLKKFGDARTQKMKDAIQNSVVLLNHAFKEKWHEDALELITKVFGDERGQSGSDK